jgi:hypothetical protein
MAELADALDLGSSSERSEGSSPFIRTYKIAIAHLLGDTKSEENHL